MVGISNGKGCHTGVGTCYGKDSHLGLLQVTAKSVVLWVDVSYGKVWSHWKLLKGMAQMVTQVRTKQ